MKKIANEDLAAVSRVALEIAKGAPPMDAHTENFLFGEEYRNVSDDAKINYLLATIGRILMAGLVGRKLDKMK